MDAVKHSVPKPVSEMLRERRFYQRRSGTNVEGSLSKGEERRGTVAFSNNQQPSPDTARSVNCLQEHSATLSRKLLLNQPVQMLSYRWMIETLDDFV